MDKNILAVVSSISLVVFMAIFGLIMAFPIMWSWNYVMPYVFKLPEIGWGHAWCLMFLAGISIKSFLIQQKT